MTDLIERLRTRNGRADGFGLGPVCDEAADELSALRAERDALRADAERYRWLRHDDMISDWEAKGIVSLYSGPDYTRLDGQALDNAIDAARAALKVEPK